MAKYKSLFNLLFTITALDNVASALTVSVIMQIISICTIDSGCYTAGVSGNTLLLTGYIVLLSPTYVFSTPIIGYLADQYGRRFALQTCLLLSAAGYLLLLVASNKQSILLTLFAALLLNAGTSSMTPVQAAIADISQGARKSYLFGLIVFVMLPLYLFFAEVGRLVLNHFHTTVVVQTWLVIIALTVTIINLLLLNFTAVARKKIFKFKKKIPFPNLIDAAGIFTKPIIILLIIFSLVEFANSWNFEHVSSAQTQNLYYKIIIMTLSLFILYPLLLTKYTSYQLLFFSLLACCVGLLGCSLISLDFTRWLFIALFTIGETLFIPTVWRLLSDFTSPHRQGLVMGFKASIWSLVWSLGLIADSKSDQFLSPYLCIIIVNVLIITGLFLVKYYFKEPSTYLQAE